MDRLKSLMDALRKLAADRSLDGHERLLGAESPIKGHVGSLQDSAKQSKLKRI